MHNTSSNAPFVLPDYSSGAQMLTQISISSDLCGECDLSGASYVWGQIYYAIDVMFWLGLVWLD